MFVSLEGIEGAGKTTTLPHLVASLEARGKTCTVTREPGGTDFGRRLRAILLDPATGAIEPKTELLLYLADRVQHVREVIQPALESGQVVLCDRYMDATVVYQGVARGLGRALIMELHRLVLGKLKPDATLLFDLPARVGLERAWKDFNQGERSRRESRFEQESLAFHEAVREGYLGLAQSEPQRFHIIDAAADPQAVARQASAALARVLRSKAPPNDRMSGDRMTP
ncbi:MAG: dTMP kinase [Desulfosarcina sp.]|nr:dTMP kinase [Desulfobacterales bacterium]